MDRVVSFEIAKKLKDSGYHVPCSHCYIWFPGDPVDEEADLDLPQHYKGEWCIFYNFIFQETEWKCNAMDWMELYVNKYHQQTDTNTGGYTFVDWNMNIFEYAQEVECDDFKDEDPEGWKNRLETYKYLEWLYTATPDEIEAEHSRVTDLLQWEQGDDWSFQYYQEFVSAPGYHEIIDWLREEHGITICIIPSMNDSGKSWQAKIYGLEDDIVIERNNYYQVEEEIIKQAISYVYNKNN